METEVIDDNIALGHRKRMRERLMSSKFGSMTEYDILEMLLFLAKPRGDTKPIAKKLLKEFGSIAKIMNTDPLLLQKIDGVGESTLSIFRIVHECAIHLIKDDLEEKPILQSWKALLDYARATMGHSKTELFRILYLDKKNMIISDELQDSGTTDEIYIYPREIIKRSLFLEASSIILIHNHPSGQTKPSQSDVDLTMQIVKAANVVGIQVHDHIIISNKSHYSFKTNGLL